MPKRNEGKLLKSQEQACTRHHGSSSGVEDEYFPAMEKPSRGAEQKLFGPAGLEREAELVFCAWNGILLLLRTVG